MTDHGSGDAEACVTERYFPRSSAYTRNAAPQPDRAREPWPRHEGPQTERALQCIWFDDRLRPRSLTTVEGESVEVEYPGTWNLGPGPDFLGAAIRLDGGVRRLEGDVEIHLRPSDWIAHRHAEDPRYARVRIHVTYYPGTLPTGALPPGSVQIALRDALLADPLFSFDQIDLAAYPYDMPRMPTPCAALLARWPRDRKEALLNAAGEERLRRKAERISAAITERGATQVFYEEFLTALGYPHNKIPFRRLAARVPWATLCREAMGDPTRAEALLMGASGLLPETLSSAWCDAYRRHIRRLWDHWWRLDHGVREGRLEPSDWVLVGLRPLNHPERRLAAAAFFLMQNPDPIMVLKSLAESDAPIRRILDWLDVRAAHYWASHASRQGRPARTSQALLGRARAVSILINVCVPLLAALDCRQPFERGWLDQLPPEAPSDRLRQIAHALFGPGHPKALYRTGLRQQGLLQIFQDHCLARGTGCASCSLPTLLASQP